MVTSSSAVKLRLLGGERLLTGGRTGGGGARSNGGAEIASVSCHRVLQEALDMREQLSSTLTRPNTQTDAGIVVTS